MSPCPPLSQVFALRTWEHMQLLHPGCSTPQKSLLPLFGHRSSGMIRGSIRSRQEDIFSPKDNSLPQSFIFSPPLPPSLLASRLIPLLPTNEAELEVQVSHCGIKQEVEVHPCLDYTLMDYTLMDYL